MYILSHIRQRQNLAELYPSNDTDINELRPVKYSVAPDIQARTAPTFVTNTGPSFKCHDDLASLH